MMQQFSHMGSSQLSRNVIYVQWLSFTTSYNRRGNTKECAYCATPSRLVGILTFCGRVFKCDESRLIELFVTCRLFYGCRMCWVLFCPAVFYLERCVVGLSQGTASLLVLACSVCILGTLSLLCLLVYYLLKWLFPENWKFERVMM